MPRIVAKSYCVQSDVERAMGVAADETNLTSAQIVEAIKSASNEVDLLTHTIFHSIEDSGTAEAGSTTTLQDTDQSWTTNEWANFVLWCHTGAGNGQYTIIASNDSDTLTVAEVTTAFGATSQYRIIPDCIESKNLNGDGTQKMFMPYYPIQALQTLTIAGTSVTPAKVYVWEDEGYLELHSQLSPESNNFTNQYPQCISVTWVYGVYPVPADIKRFTAVIAGLQCLITQIGGTYNDVTSYSIPHLTASKGEPYVNIREALLRLIKEKDRTIKSIIKYPVVWG